MYKYQQTEVWNFEKQVTPDNIINRRDIEPFLDKAVDTLKTYEHAMGCMVAVLDQTGHAVEASDYKKTIFFCSLCKRFYHDPEKQWAADEYPCSGMHKRGVDEARTIDAPYIYMCKMGFVFWACPVYSGGRFAGSLIAGRVLGIDRKKACENISELCRGILSREKIQGYLSEIPERTYDEIKAQAHLLNICAKKLSEGSIDSTDVIKQSFEKKDRAHIHITGKNGTEEQGHSLEKERLFLASLRRGDNKTGLKILNEIINDLFVANSGSLDMPRLRAMELVVILSRAKADRELGGDILEANDKYLKWIEDSRSAEELNHILRMIIERMSGNIFFFQGVRHSSALRKAERFIWENYTRKISLQEIADASGLSAPYFSTIFKEEMGENLSNYLNRLRIEKAATMLTETDKTINEITEECGFGDQSWFSKIFKGFMGLSPGKYRENGSSHISAPFHITPKRPEDKKTPGAKAEAGKVCNAV
jgi:AraC-like DNA-binding protein/ligand-binding sensor protein